MAAAPAEPAAHADHGPEHGATLTLAIAFAGLIVYASLYPFTDWHWPAGASLRSMLMPPWPRYHIRFDIWSNFVGYMPMGALILGAATRRGWRPVTAGLLGMVLPSALSWTMEFTQHFLPNRYPSSEDWLLNSLGAVGGVLAWGLLQHGGVLARWHQLRERWFTPHSGTTLALLMLWPTGFLFPSTVPFGLGPSWERMQEWLYDALADHPMSAWFDWAWASLGAAANALSPASEGLAEALGVLGPSLLAYTVMRPGWRRTAVVPSVLAVGFGASTLSAALNFGPLHALAWITPVVPVSLGVGAVVALLCAPLGRRACAALGLVTLCAGTMLVAQAPSDPYYSESLAAWEQGRFIRFHGLAQWIGWLWPLAAGGALFARLAPVRRPAAARVPASPAPP